MDDTSTLGAYVTALLARTTGRHAPRTQRAYDLVLTRYLAGLADRTLAQLTPDVIRAHLDALATHLAPVTVRWVRSILSGWCEDAVEAGVLEENPVRRVRPKRYKGQSPTRLVLGRDELARLLTALTSSPYFGPALACARAGLRPGEALALHAEDVDVPMRRLLVRRSMDSQTRVIRGATKSRKARTVDVSRELAACLAARLVAVPQGHLWPGLHYDGFRRALARACRRAGVPTVAPHSLRHSCASLLIADGVSPAYVQRLLGHRSIDLTVHLYGSHLAWRDLGAVDGLDGPGPEPPPRRHGPQGLRLVQGRGKRRA